MIDAEAVLLCWIPVAAVLFAVLPPARAITLAYLAGWLLMPVGEVSIPGFWDLDKILVTNVGVVLGTLFFCPQVLRGYRPHLADLFLLIYCGSGLAASITNGLGLYDGVSRFSYLMLFYGAPYFAGRVFFKRREDFVRAAETVVLASACYSLLALWEWKMSPQFHKYLYGAFQHAWDQHYRWGFWRPIVFFEHALALGTFFSWTSLLAVWLWRAGILDKRFGMYGWLIVAGPILGLLSSMSFGPWGMFIVGCGLLYGWEYLRFKPMILVPVVLAVMWMGMRYTATSKGDWLPQMVSKISADRAESVQYRITVENMLIEKAKRRPIFGWGTWGRNRVMTEEGQDRFGTDGAWVIILGTSGLVGLAGFYLWWCWPVVMQFLIPRWSPGDPAIMTIIVAIGLQAVSLIFNDFLSPILILLCGGLVTLLTLLRTSIRQQVHARRLQAMGTQAKARQG